MKTLVSQISRTASLLAILSPSLAFAADVAGQPPMPVVVGTNEILTTGASLVLVVVSIVLVGWLYSRMHGIRGHKSDFVSVLATQALGPKERVLLIEVAGEQLVLGITATQIQTLHVLQQPIKCQSKAPVSLSFADRLRRATKGERK